MNAEPVFIDTNILIYANVAGAPFHEQALDALKLAQQSERPLWISRQVLREFISARTRPQTFAQPSTTDVVIERVRYLEERFQVADDTASVTEQLINLLGNFKIGGRQIHDANIVATMLAYNIPCLLTHNIKDFRRFEKLIKIEPIDNSV
jgi:predicted nucleic acid-binding protein